MTNASRTKISTSVEAGELAIAHAALAAALPKHLPNVEGIEIATIHAPSKELSGDLYDIIELSEELLAFVVFGMNDRGVAATLKAFMTKIAFSNHIRAGISPRAIMNRVTGDLAASLDVDLLSSAFVGLLDLHSNRLSYAHHGHASVALFRSKDQSVTVQRPVPPAPGSPRRQHEEKNVALNPGDWFVVFSRGFEMSLCDGVGGGSFETALATHIKGAGPTRCLQRVGALRRKDEYHVVESDVTAIAVEMQTQSRRNLLKQELGFEPGDPAYLQHLSYFEEMDKVIAVILRSMDNQGYADDTIRKMKITLTELLVNGLHHGNDKDPNKKVTVGHIIDKNRTIVSVLDEGNGFDPAKVPDPTLPENLIKDSGRGLYIVRCYVDDLLFNTKGNRVTIIKYGYGHR